MIPRKRRRPSLPQLSRHTRTKTHQQCSTSGCQLALFEVGSTGGNNADFDPLLAQLEPRGETYEAALDRKRLGRQLRDVLQLMGDGIERSIQEISENVEGAQTAISARLRDLRRLGYRVESRRVGSSGTWVYRVRRGMEATNE